MFEEAIIELKRIQDNLQTDLVQLRTDKEEVIQRYQKIFSKEYIPKLTKEEFQGFLNTKNNKHWTMDRIGGYITKDIDKLREALLILVDKTISIDKRLDKLVPDNKPVVPYLSKSAISPILQIIEPDKYGVWNKISIEALNILKIHPEFKKDYSFSKKYRLFNEVLLNLAEGLGVDLWTLDSFLWQLVTGDRFSSESNNEVNENRRIQYYKIAPGKNAWAWDSWVKKGYASIGWNELGDLTGLSKTEFLKKAEECKAKYNFSKTGMLEVWRFRNIKKGDILVANQGFYKILGIGVVKSDYYYEEGEGFYHKIKVDWYDTRIREIKKSGAWRYTIIELSESNFNEITKQNILPIVEKIDELEVPAYQYSLADFIAETSLKQEDVNVWLAHLRRKKQIILYGSPGTGKTFIAERLGRLLVSASNGEIDVVQFHPSYSYEDFIQGIKPEYCNEKKSLEYPLKKGRFFNFCDKIKNKGNSVLIIDEINRAELSRVFGELMYLLEYRDKSLELASGGSFKIPENLFIIGTMNTADRSIALVDYALRRRFAFIRINPDYDILRKWHEKNTGYDIDSLVSLLEEINGRIKLEDYSIGISYFMDMNIVENIESIWKLEIGPYLEEFFYNKPEIIKDFVWDKIRSKLF